MNKKLRLDEYLFEAGEAQSLNEAAALVTAGLVIVNEHRVDKKGFRIKPGDNVRVKRKNLRYVSRGGLKLEKALNEFELDVNGKLCLDIGSSTGGFTDCLLQHGAKHVFAVDSGSNQMDYKLRKDERVTLRERTNARFANELSFAKESSIAVCDISFISVLSIANAVFSALPNLEHWIVLIKPQFEARREELPEGAVIKDASLREKIVRRFVEGMSALGFLQKSFTESPISGAKGNIEYLSLFTKYRRLNG